MRCYEYCQALFDEVFLPVLQERFPEILPRLSAGVVGMGSDVLGADDELSRDHDWGPSKCQLLLPEPDVKKCGSSIAQALQAAVPDGFQGVSLPEMPPKTIRVSTIDTVYRGLCESAYPPETVEEWAAADDNDLCYASSASRRGMAQFHGQLEMEDPAANEAWRRFRYERITNLVREVLAPAARAYGKQVTAAVFPNWEQVRQEWSVWGLDAYLPMLYHSFYEEGIDWIRDHCERGVAALPEGTPLYSGLFVPELVPDELAQACRVSMEGGASGVSLFASGSMSDAHWEVFTQVSRELGG